MMRLYVSTMTSTREEEEEEEEEEERVCVRAGESLLGMVTSKQQKLRPYKDFYA